MRTCREARTKVAEGLGGDGAGEPGAGRVGGGLNNEGGDMTIRGASIANNAVDLEAYNLALPAQHDVGDDSEGEESEGEESQGEDDGDAGYGGGIVNRNKADSLGVMVVDGSTVTGNRAPNAAGLHNEGGIMSSHGTAILSRHR